MSCLIEKQGKALKITCPPTADNIRKCREIPDRRVWSAMHSAWVARATAQNVKYLIEQWPEAHWDPGAQEVRDRIEALVREGEDAMVQKELDNVVIDDYRFGTEPYDHQRKAFAISRDRQVFALFMEQGTGKTKVVIDNACYLFQQGKIDGVLIVSPNSVKDVWVEEVEKHTPEFTAYQVAVYDSGMSSAERRAMNELIAGKDKGKKLAWLVMNVEAFSFDSGLDLAKKFLARYTAMMAVDESTRIKTPSAKRTRKVIKAGQSAEYRRILTGTPATQGPLDVYAPFRFLDPDLLGFGSFYAFKNRYAIMGGYQGKEIIGFGNLEELQALVAPYSFRVTREEALDLPPKSYKKIEVRIKDEQKRLYAEMRDLMLTELEGQEVQAVIVLTQMLRLQQITGGFLPPSEEGEQPTPIPGKNPKIEALLDVAEDAQGKILIWARFRAEIDLIARALRERFGDDSVVEFHGGTSTDDRTKARSLFQDPESSVRFFVGNQQTGGLGLTLTQAKTVVYFSNSFSLEERLQSEDRAHRAGLEHPVLYVDIVAKGTLDGYVLGALRNKKSLADQITGDDWKEWI